MKIRVLAALVLSATAAFSATAREGRSDGDAPLLRARIETADPAALRAQLESAGYDVLRENPPDSTVEVVVSRAELHQLQSSGLNVVAIEQGRPLSETLQQQAALAAVPANYRDLDGIITRMREIAAVNPGIAQVVDVTATYGAPPTFEGRHLFALKISDNVAVDEDEPAVLIASTHHAREIVAPVIALNAAERLTGGYGSDPRITAAVNDHAIWIAPVWNPDGYNYVFTVDNLWRKNRRVFSNGVGVDQNRNYPQGWGSPCPGSLSATSETYRGPAPASEAETQTMMMWSQVERFDKVIDYHSYGREVLYAYRCLGHPFTSWMQGEAAALSRASGYSGATRVPSADGEHQQWQFAQMGAYAFLIETHNQFQPLFGSALNEAALVWPGILSVIERPISVSGHVTDAVTGAALEADIELLNVAFSNGETNSSGGRYGRYHMVLPPGTYDVRFSKDGYVPVVQTVSVTSSSAAVIDIQLSPPDTTPPVRSGGQPTGALPAETTQTTLALTTNEAATCRYSPSAGVPYDAMTQTFVTTGGTAHSTPVSGLVDGGRYTFSVRCLDAAGNANPDDFAITFTVDSDTTPPDTTLTATPPAVTNSPGASFSFTATEVGSTFQCTLDGGTFAACTSPQSYSALAVGNHTFQVRATDPAGNTDPTPASFTWTIDTAAFDTALTATPPAVTNSPGASFSFTATEAGSTFECTLDGGGFAPCTSPQNYSGLAGGNHTFQVRATDPAGNIDPTPASFAWTIDTTPPDTTLTATPPAVTNSPSASFSFTATETGSTFQCTLDGGAFVACTSPQSYSALAGGSHTFQVRATDPAGNADSTPASFTWTVDTAAPDTALTATPPAVTNSPGASFSFTATETGSAFQCTLDGGAFVACTSPQSYSALAGGSHTFQVRAADPAGNTDPTPASYTWIIDTTPPVRSGGQPTGTLPAGTTQTTLALTTNEAATCRYSPSAGVPYDAMTQTFATTGGTAHSTPVSGLVDGGSYTFSVRCLDAVANANPDDFAISFTVDTPPVMSTVFFDDFETDRGWTRNPNGTDTATAGRWERGDPQPTSSNGPKQLGTTVSGVNCLVTGRLAGSSAGANDIDGGVTSIRSPAIALPSTGTLTLSFSYYLAHTSNASSADFLRVRVVGSTTAAVFERQGAATDADAVWRTASVSLNAFGGQTIRILIEAADAGAASLVEAAIDDVRITRQ
jgi:hypothetical protein